MHHAKIEDFHPFEVDSEKWERQLYILINNFTKKVKKNARIHLLGYLTAFVLLTGLGFLLFASLLIPLTPVLTAFSLSFFLLGIFSCYIFHRFIVIQKSEKCHSLVSEFKELSSQICQWPCGVPQRHSTLALAYAIFAENLNGLEYRLCFVEKIPQRLAPLLESINCFLFWKDIFLLKEILLLASLQEYLDLVKSDPINLTYHSQLANAYILLSRTYRDPRNDESLGEHRWISKKRYDKLILDKYHHATERAIEEFKIISSYAPDDPWVHAQLALSYKDLDLPFEEIQACEALLRLSPSDKDTLHRLGKLYFKLGANAKGLEVYRQLCHINCDLAAQLICQYGAAAPHSRCEF